MGYCLGAFTLILGSIVVKGTCSITAKHACLYFQHSGDLCEFQASLIYRASQGCPGKTQNQTKAWAPEYTYGKGILRSQLLYLAMYSQTICLLSMALFPPV